VTDDRVPTPSFLRDLLRVTPHRFDPALGLGAAAVLILPLVADALFGLGTSGVLVTFGVLNLFFAAMPRPHATPPRLVLLAIATNAVGFLLGSVLVQLPVALELPLTAVAVSVVLLAGRHPHWENLGGMTAVMLVIGIGLPSPNLGAIPLRSAEVALGGAVGFAAWYALTRWLPPLPRDRADPSGSPPASVTPIPIRTMLPYASVVGATVAIGLGIGLGLGLARDYWIMLTIVVALRQEWASTLAFAAARIVGTVTGASIAFFVTMYVSDPVILVPIFFASAALTISTRAVNNTLYAVWVTIFVIGLLNLLYAGGPNYAVLRIIDTLIGGGLALLAALLLSRAVRHRRLVAAAQT
jgi:Fusaric acid resistance protein-like